MAGVMGPAPTCLQRDGLASRLLRLHAQWLPRQDSHLFDLVQSQAGYCYLTRRWSSTEVVRLLLRFGRSWQTALSVCLSTPVLRKVVPRIGLAPMTSCSSGRRSTWTELPWVSNWWVRGELHSHEKSRRPLKPVRLLFRHGPAEMVGRTGLAPVKPGGQRFYRPPVLLLTHRPQLNEEGRMQNEE